MDTLQSLALAKMSCNNINNSCAQVCRLCYFMWLCYHVTGKYWCSAHKGCNIKVKLNYKIPIVFHKLKSYYSHLVKQELGKFNFETNVTPNWQEKYMSFNMISKLSFVTSIHYLNFLSDSLVKNLNKEDFKYLSQEFNSDQFV